MNGLTYVALKPVKVAGKMRQPGDLVPEAARWHNLPAYLSTGKISAIPEDSVAVKTETVEQVTEELTGYESLTADEVKAQVEDGAMTVEEAYEEEMALEKPRKTVISWLEKQAEAKARAEAGVSNGPLGDFLVPSDPQEPVEGE